MKKVLILIGVMFCLVGTCLAANLTIESNKQSFKEEQNKIYLDGNVRVKLDELHVTSPRAEVNLDPETHEVKDVNFLDNAYSYQVKNNKKHEIKANIIKMSLLNKTVTAQGNAQSSVTQNKKPLIVVTAEQQEYNNNTNVMSATGAVVIYYKDVETYSNTAIVDLDKSNEIKRIQLIGNGIIKQKNSKITASRFSYDTNREEAIATGNVFTDVNMEDGTALKVWSDYQMYDQKPNVLVASGNAVIKYKDYTATGPKASVFPNKVTNKLNEVIFLGRSKIEQQGRTIEADRIRMTLKPKDFSAEGNVKTLIPNVKSVEQ